VNDASPIDLRAIARALSGEAVGGQVMCPGPRHSPRDRSLSVKLSATAPDGFTVHSFAGDDWQTCKDLVRGKLGLERVRRQIPSEPRRERKRETQQDTVERARWLWGQRQPITEDTPPWPYLRRTRAYDGPIPATLGYLPPRNGHPPAMIAPFGVATEPEPGVLAIAKKVVRAVHITGLKADGSDRVGKIMVGQGAMGFPICLAPPNDGLSLAITEGIEDALSIHAALGVGAWAAGSAPFMPALAAKVPPFVEAVYVFGHRDGGERFARDLSRRLDVRGFEVILKFVEGRP
jgi:Toprim domain